MIGPILIAKPAPAKLCGAGDITGSKRSVTEITWSRGSFASFAANAAGATLALLMGRGSRGRLPQSFFFSPAGLGGDATLWCSARCAWS